MALRRIAWDLRALQESPLPGIAAEPLAEDLWTWHFNVRGARGELQGLAVHGVLRLPRDYPAAPPEVRLCTPLPHPNVWSVGEGFAVCMDVLEAGTARAPYSGWSSSYCVGSLLLQLQSVLFDERARVTDVVTVQHAVRAAEECICRCGHHSSHPRPAFPSEEDLRVKATRIVARPPLSLLCRSPVSARQAPRAVLASAAAAPAASPFVVPGVTLSTAGVPAEGACAPLGSEWASEEAWCEVRPRRREQRGKENSESVTPPDAAAGPKVGWGIRRTLAPEEMTKAQLRNAKRAKARAEKRRAPAPCEAYLARECEASALAPAVYGGPGGSPADAEEGAQGAPPQRAALARIPRRLLIEVLMFLAPEDAACMSICGYFCAALGEDGLLWKHLFCRRFPSSELTAERLADWKHCFLLEVNHVEADLACFHTKATFRETVLGIPLDYSVNPRTQQVDYISTTLDYLSVEAFDSGVRTSQWNEPFKLWLPVFVTPEHFQRARPRFERTVVQLSPHWRVSRFSPLMVLEVVPKIMNTMVVLICDKGLEASDRALEGYFLLWRLLAACVEAYGLQPEVRRRVAAFRAEANRVKSEVPSLGDFLPLLTVCDLPSLGWEKLGRPVLEESFDRHVLWICRDNPDFARPDRNVLGQGADLRRLQATLASIKVSSRLHMFHVRFLHIVKQQTLDLFYGRPQQHLRQAFQAAVRSILAVKTWPDFFAACRQPCPGPSALTNILKQAVKNSRKKGYHSDATDFSRIQASGVSHILRKGESYSVSESVKQVHLELGSDSSMILCGACLVYEDLTCAQVVSYDSTRAYGGAVRHSGDTVVDGKSRHVMEVQLSRLPASVTRLFFTLCACGGDDLSSFRQPSISMQDAAGKPLCSYSIGQAGRAPTVVMAAIARSGGAWRVTALGQHSAVRCCGNYSQVKRDIASIKL